MNLEMRKIVSEGLNMEVKGQNIMLFFCQW